MDIALTKIAKLVWIGSVICLQLVATVAQGANGCAELFQRAMDTLHNSCAEVGRNEACYGNQSIMATLRDSALSFNSVGERVNVAEIERLTASALDLETQHWGLSLLKLKVNLPDTLPGANVTFLIHGGTSVENVSGDMQVFYFTSSLGEPQCKQMPPSAIVVHSPNHERVTFVANGVEVNVGSTVVMSAQPNASMDVYLVEGSATLTAGGRAVALQPNEMTSIPLGGSDGLQAVGAPSVPTTQVSDAITSSLITDVDDLFDEDKTGDAKANAKANNSRSQSNNSANGKANGKDKEKDKEKNNGKGNQGTKPQKGGR
ncbi:MAG: hypothetical protein KF716_27355 [Anaerolineae bacterium]|nr:hypothetical protein [Anaerolineae bacterium]